MRYEIIESKSWKRDDGMTASLYGAIPWTSEAEKSRWIIKVRGYTLHDTKDNTIGLGHKPFKTIEEAQELANKLNK